MRIVLAGDTFAPERDDAADITRHLADHVLADGHELLVLTGGVGTASYRGARVVRSRRLLPDSTVSLTLRAFGPDVVVAVAPRTLGGVAVRAAVRAGRPTLVVDGPAGPGPGLRALATSRAMRDLLAPSGTRAELWTPGIQRGEHHPGLREERLRERWANRRPLVVGHLGPVTKEKVVRRLERVAAMDQVRLVVLGGAEDGRGRRHLERLRSAGARISRASASLELARGVASLDVLVQPRKKESAVLGVRRALASGVPVVAFDAGGARDVVEHGVNGLLADPARGRGLRDHLRRLAGDPALRERLAAGARGTDVADWSEAWPALLEHVRRVIGTAEAARTGRTG